MGALKEAVLYRAGAAEHGVFPETGNAGVKAAVPGDLPRGGTSRAHIEGFLAASRRYFACDLATLRPKPPRAQARARWRWSERLGGGRAWRSGKQPTRGFRTDAGRGLRPVLAPAPGTES